MFHVVFIVFLFTRILANFSFLSIADWGGVPHWPFYTKPQKANASGMDRIAGDLGAKLVLAAGDNFYYSGVAFTSARIRLERTWKKVYLHDDFPYLSDTHWYVVAGNHDHRGNVEAQISLSEKEPQWHFPKLYYTFSKKFKSNGEELTVQFVMIDTVVLRGLSEHDHEENIFRKAMGPEDESEAEKHMDWILETLATSKAEYLFVVGHYPIYSPCNHGSNEELIRDLKPILEQFQVTAYIAGHDHCASYTDEGKGPVYVMNGMGVTCCYHAINKDTIPEGAMKWHMSQGVKHEYDHPKSGFMSYTLSSDGAIIRFHDHRGHIMESFKNVKRRPPDLLKSSTMFGVAKDFLRKLWYNF